MELPSPLLMQQLTDVGLALPADLKRAAARVRRISRGLPPSDSIWIDALVTTRRLTPWQGQRLESGAGPQLILGDQYVLQKPRILDSIIPTYQAQSRRRKQTHFISGFRSNPKDQEETQARLTAAVSDLAALKDKLPGLPTEALLENGQHWLVSPFQPGESAANLLVRRGRFPESVVKSLALELLQQLFTAEGICPHGDLRLKNLWLTQRGELQLLNWQFLSTVEPVITIHSRLPADAADGLAPERLSRQAQATITSDIYAFGCLLWQLLAGRPPFLVADHLAKFTCHQSRSLPDLRQVCPNVSQPFVEIIQLLTQRDASERPQNWSDVKSVFRGVRRKQSGVQKFARSFEDAAPLESRELRTSRSTISTPLKKLAATVLITATLTGLAWNREHLGLPHLSRLGAHEATSRSADAQAGGSQPPPLNTALSETKSDAIPNTATEIGRDPKTAELTLAPETRRELKTQTLVALPSPVNGKLLLESGQHYDAGTIESSGTLQIEVAGESNANIYVNNSPLIVRGTQISLKGINIIASPQLRQGAIQVEAEALLIEHCIFQSQTASEVKPTTFAFAQWQCHDDDKSLRLLIKDTEILHEGDAFELNTPLETALLQNVHSELNRVFLRLRRGVHSGHRVPIVLQNCTFEESGPILALNAHSMTSGAGIASLQGSGTLIDLTMGDGLIELEGSNISADWPDFVEISAQEFFLPSELILVLSKNPSSGAMDELDDDKFVADGLSTANYRFLPSKSPENPRKTLQIDSMTTRSSLELPGAVLTRLPMRPNSQ